MALKYLTDIDLNKNELQNVVIQVLPSDPQNLTTKSNNSAGDSGLVWFNSSDGFLKYFNGTQTIPIGRMNFEASTANIKMDGTVSVGSLNTVARADHTHPSDTSRVPTTRTINGKMLTQNINLLPTDVGLFYGKCSTNMAVTTKEVTISSFSDTIYPDGMRVAVLFEDGSFIDSPSSHMSLKINNLNARPVYTTGTNSLYRIGTNEILEFVYVGSYSTGCWRLLGEVDTNTTYATGTSGEIEAGTSTVSKIWTPKVLHDYVASAAGAAADAMRFKGTIGTNGDITTLPTTNVNIGDTYRVITASTYADQACEVGDLIIATSTTPTWTVAQTNIDGAITRITGTSPVSVSGSGSSRTVAVSNATTASAGLMSATDKRVFDRAKLEVFYYDTEDDNSVTMESYDGSWSDSLLKVGARGAANGVAPLNASTKIDPKYLPIATTASAGAMSAQDKIYLDNLVSHSGAIMYEYENPALTPDSGGVCHWKIDDSKYFTLRHVQVQVFDNSSNDLVMPDINVDGSVANGLTISIVSPTTIAASSYRAILVGQTYSY